MATVIDTGIAGVNLRELHLFRDSRGWLAEVYRQDESEHQPVMAYISVTQPNVARGPHEHDYQADLFVFAGPGNFTIYLYDNRPQSPTYKASYSETFGEKRPAWMTVPAGVIHAYRCISSSPGLILNLPDKLYKGPGKKEEIDEIRHENDPNSPFYSVFDRALFMNE